MDQCVGNTLSLMVNTLPRMDQTIAVCLNATMIVMWVSMETEVDVIEDNKCNYWNRVPKLLKIGNRSYSAGIFYLFLTSVVRQIAI